MTIIRKIEIENFRGIGKLEWFPSPGINCLIGPGDSGKSTILDAIDYCLGARRNLAISDTDFHRLQIDPPIKIAITLGDLDDSLMSIEAYGQYLRGFDAKANKIVDEPEAEIETVLTLTLTVLGDLEPNWTLHSERAAKQGLTRNLNFTDRVRLAPTRMGVFSENNLGWRRGSILNRLSEERAHTSAALVEAAREMRNSFGEQAKEQLKETLAIVTATAKELGIPAGDEVKAMLDAHSVSISGGTISLHDEEGVPLKNLGLGSARLLVAGLQRQAAENASMILIDELEYGLEPHRIICLLQAIGSNESLPPLQAFITTHSPVAVRELSGDQIFIVREGDEGHSVLKAGTSEDVQGTIRIHPDALLAPSILVCEGASEVGFVRGLNHYQTAQGEISLTASGVALVDGGGTNTFTRANAFLSLGYRTAVLRDSDVIVDAAQEKAFTDGGGIIFPWEPGRGLEDELFLSFTDDAIGALIEKAVELKEEKPVDDHIRSASNGNRTLENIRMSALLDGYSEEDRKILAAAAKSGRGWFKSVSAMESVAHDILAAKLNDANEAFSNRVATLFAWIRDVGR